MLFLHSVETASVDDPLLHTAIHSEISKTWYLFICSPENSIFFLRLKFQAYILKIRCKKKNPNKKQKQALYHYLYNKFTFKTVPVLTLVSIWSTALDLVCKVWAQMFPIVSPLYSRFLFLEHTVFVLCPRIECLWNEIFSVLSKSQWRQILK